MDLQQTWKTCFEKWPEDLPRQGVLVTTFGEQVPFAGFSVGESMVLLARKAPDTVGARTLIIPYQHVAAVKLVDVVKSKVFTKLGFEGKLPSYG